MTKIGHSENCAKLLKDLDSKVSLGNVAFKFGAGPQKILTVTLKWTNKFFYNIFVDCARGEFLLRFLLKAKNKEKLHNTFFLLQKNQFAYIEGLFKNVLKN